MQRRMARLNDRAAHLSSFFRQLQRCVAGIRARKLFTMPQRDGRL